MRKSTIALAAVVAAFLLGCGATPEKKDTVTPVLNGSGTPAAAATGSTGNAPAGPKKLKVNEVGALSLGDGSTGEITVTSVKVQGKSIVANVTIKCTGGAMKYNMFDWKAIAGDGTTLNSGFDIGVKNQLNSGDIGPGQTVKGNLVFEGTAAQAKGAQILFDPGLSGTLAYWVAP